MEGRHSIRQAEDALGPDGTIDDSVLFLFFENQLTEDERAIVLEILNSDPVSFVLAAECAKGYYAELSPATDAELEQFGVDREAQLQFLIREGLLHPELLQRSARTNSRHLPVRSLWPAIRHALQWPFSPAGLALVAALLLFFVGKPAYQGWKADQLAQQGADMLVDHYLIDDLDMPRPSGGFLFSAFGLTRAGEEDTAASAIAETFASALAYDRQNPQALDALATYYLLARPDSLDRAAQLYQHASEQDPANPALLNDRGVIAFRLGKYEEALQLFSTVLQKSPGHSEALYNFALTLEKLDRREEAKQTWERFVELHAGSNWAMAAQAHLKKLSRQ